MVKVTIYKANGQQLETIDNPTELEVKGPVLTVRHSTSEGEVTIRTTLPYYVKEGAGIAEAKTKAATRVAQKPKPQGPPPKGSAWS